MSNYRAIYLRCAYVLNKLYKETIASNVDTVTVANNVNNFYIYAV